MSEAGTHRASSLRGWQARLHTHQSKSMRTSRSSRRAPFRYFTHSSVSRRQPYSTKQKPHGVFWFLSRPMTMRFSGPHLLNSSWICSSVVWNARLPTYTVVERRRHATYSSRLPSNLRSLYCDSGSRLFRRRLIAAAGGPRQAKQLGTRALEDAGATPRRAGRQGARRESRARVFATSAAGPARAVERRRSTC